MTVGALKAVGLSLATVSISGCQACDQADEVQRQAQEGVRIAHEAEETKEQAERDAEAVQERASDLRQSGEEARDTGGSGLDSAVSFAKTAVGISKGDSNKVQLGLGAAEVANVVAFQIYLKSLSSSDDNPTTEAVANQLDAAYAAADPATKDNINFGTTELDRYGAPWSSLTDPQKIEFAGAGFAGSGDLFRVVQRDIQSRTP